jgi:hypothetical protein
VRARGTGRSLVLAGILERQADELKDAYAPYGCSWKCERQRGRLDPHDGSALSRCSGRSAAHGMNSSMIDLSWL